MKLCMSLKKAFPEMISGYDLVGHEAAGPPLVDFLPELLWFRQSCSEEGLDIPFYFHAGECLGNETHVDGNMFDAIILSSRRLGHA
jgi:adenosine deaminase CECR1